jgi:hypothetical protein
MRSGPSPKFLTSSATSSLASTNSFSMAPNTKWVRGLCFEKLRSASDTLGGFVACLIQADHRGSRPVFGDLVRLLVRNPSFCEASIRAKRTSLAFASHLPRGVQAMLGSSVSCDWNADWLFQGWIDWPSPLSFRSRSRCHFTS